MKTKRSSDIQREMRRLELVGAAARRVGREHAGSSKALALEDAQRVWFRHRELGLQRRAVARVERAQLLALRAAITGEPETA